MSTDYRWMTADCKMYSCSSPPISFPVYSPVFSAFPSGYSGASAGIFLVLKTGADNYCEILLHTSLPDEFLNIMNILGIEMDMNAEECTEI